MIARAQQAITRMIQEGGLPPEVIQALTQANQHLGGAPAPAAPPPPAPPPAGGDDKDAGGGGGPPPKKMPPG